jgi:Choline/Carnitine o-acyltransferase
MMGPFPPADSVFAKIAETTVDGPRRRKHFLWLLKRLGIIDYAENNRRNMISLAERGINPFDLETVPKGFSGLYPEMSVSILFEKMDGPIAQRAAKVVLATLEYRQALLENSLEQETSGEMVIDNYRNHNFFGRVANIRKVGLLKWSKEIRHCRSSAHIVVAVNGAFYKLDVLDGGGAIMAAERILSGIESIIRTAERDKASAKPYGVVTTNITRSSDAIFYARRLDESIRTIDEAIFLLAIDHINAPADENAAAQDLHIRNHHNRDYRKSLQVAVLENGYCGATINFFAEIEGVFAARMASWVSSRARTMSPIVSRQSSDDVIRLQFETIDFDRLPLRRLKGKIARYSCSLPLIKKVDAFGRDAIKQLRVSPDAFFHAAAHLAYYERFKKIPAVHNFADMRGVKFGSITRYLSTTDEMVAFLRSQTRPALLAALDAHRRTIAVIKSGDYPLHYAYYYLYSAGGLKPLLGMIMFKAFVPDVFRKHVSPDIGASNIPALPGLYCVGRFGTFFKAARRNCLAGHYLIFPDHIKTCFLASEQGFLESWQFDRSLQDAMMRLERILSQRHDDESEAKARASRAVEW